MYRVMWIFLTPVLMWLGLALVGLDQFTTLSAATLSRVIVGSWAAITFHYAITAYLCSDNPAYWIERLKRDRRPAWLAAGILFAMLMSGLSGIVADRLARTAAQYLPGERRQVTGKITSVYRQRGRGVCRYHVTVLPSSAKKTYRVCARVFSRAAIGPEDLEPGQTVIIQLKDTSLGAVVTGLNRGE